MIARHVALGIIHLPFFSSHFPFSINTVKTKQNINLLKNIPPHNIPVPKTLLPQLEKQLGITTLHDWYHVYKSDVERVLGYKGALKKYGGELVLFLRAGYSPFYSLYSYSLILHVNELKKFSSCK